MKIRLDGKIYDKGMLDKVPLGAWNDLEESTGITSDQVVGAFGSAPLSPNKRLTAFVYVIKLMIGERNLDFDEMAWTLVPDDLVVTDEEEAAEAADPTSALTDSVQGGESPDSEGNA